MPANVAEAMNQWEFSDAEDKNQIGLKNALYRIKLYYGDEAEVHVESRENEYTKVNLVIPVEAGNEISE